MLPQMTAYTNTIIQAHLQFQGEGWRVNDRAFRIQAASYKSTNWKGVDPSLYARFVSSLTRHSAICQFCCSSSHSSASCPWGVDELPQRDSVTISSPGPARNPYTPNRAQPPVCLSWNSGACRFLDTCRFHHVCATCYSPGHRYTECRRMQSRQRGPPALLPHPTKRPAQFSFPESRTI